MPSNDHVVGDLDLIVDFGAFADYRIAQAAAIDARSSTNFNVILNQHPSGLRYLQRTPRSEGVPKTILPDAAARMN